MSTALKPCLCGCAEWEYGFMLYPLTWTMTCVRCFRSTTVKGGSPPQKPTPPAPPAAPPPDDEPFPGYWGNPFG